MSWSAVRRRTGTQGCLCELRRELALLLARLEGKREWSKSTNVFVLDVLAWSSLRFDHVVRLLRHVEYEHLCRNGDGEDGVVGAGVHVVVSMDNLLDTRN